MGAIGIGFNIIGYATCLFECPVGDFWAIKSLAFYSISMPKRLEMLSIPKKSSLMASIEAEDTPFANHDLEYPPNSSVQAYLTGVM